MSLRNVALHPAADRFRFVVHSQRLSVIRLQPGENRIVRVSSGASSSADDGGGDGSEPLHHLTDRGSAVSESLPPLMYMIRVSALHELTITVEASQ